MTAMSKPKPATLRKNRSSMRPASMRLECPSRAIRAAPSRSRAGTPTDLARSHPVPAGTRPRAASTPERMMALPTLLHVPSPPTATMRRKPRPSASMVRRPSSRRWSRRGRVGAQGLQHGGDQPRSPALSGPRVEDDKEVVGRRGHRRSGRLELDQRLEGLQSGPHPQLAERNLVDLGDAERLVEG